MNLLIKADDLGFTEAVNYGIVKTLKNGITTLVGLMSNMEAAEHGADLVRSYSHISLGQHTNIVVGKPICDPDDIPSLVDEKGNFISSKVRRNSKEDLISFEDAVKETKAQLNQFIEITGKKPAYLEGHAICSQNFDAALKFVAKENNIFYLSNKSDDVLKTNIRIAKFPTMDKNNMYDVFKYIFEDEAEISGCENALMTFHPGYIDEELLQWSSFTMIRPKETFALCSKKVKDFFWCNKVKLVNLNEL